MEYFELEGKIHLIFVRFTDFLKIRLSFFQVGCKSYLDFSFSIQIPGIFERGFILLFKINYESKKKIPQSIQRIHYDISCFPFDSFVLLDTKNVSENTFTFIFLCWHNLSQYISSFKYGETSLTYLGK
jgi:hypothetical protein